MIYCTSSLSRSHFGSRLVEWIKSILEREPRQFNLENSILITRMKNYDDACSVSSRGFLQLEGAPFVFAPLDLYPVSPLHDHQIQSDWHPIAFRVLPGLGPLRRFVSKENFVRDSSPGPHYDRLIAETFSPCHCFPTGLASLSCDHTSYY